VQPGNRAVVTDIGTTKLGLSICYDVRFPALFHALASHGAQIITCPAAFTVPSGTAHWHVLLRARAIETGCFVMAAAQTGSHAGGRRTYGHSLIIDPWGQILADAGENPGIIIADIDLNKVNTARSAIPSLQHSRSFCVV
jgi:predicted amidohydrolase